MKQAVQNNFPDPGESLRAVPLELVDSLRIRDGLADETGRRVPLHVLQAIQAHLNRFRFKGLSRN